MPAGLSVLRLYLFAATILVVVRVVQLAVGSCPAVSPRRPELTYSRLDEPTHPKGPPMILATATLSFATILRHAVTDHDGHRIGTLSDVIVRLREDNYPYVSGLVVAVGGTLIFVSAADLAALTPNRVELGSSTGNLDEFTRREGEVLLAADILGHRLIDHSRVAFVKAYDVQLTQVLDGWAVTGVDVHRWPWAGIRPRHSAHPVRDWHDFEPLIGHAESARARQVSGRPPQLRSAQIADTTEEATEDGQDGLFADRTDVHRLPGYHGLTAGGLMGTEFLALPATATVADALTAVRDADAQPQSLVALYTLRPDGALHGALSLVGAIQAQPEQMLADVADEDVVVARPTDDIVDVTTRMADFNLLAMPVVSDDRHIVGVITIDDALVAAISRNWSNRSSLPETGSES